jgi:hypothetical protein
MSKYILPDILQYILNDYLDHQDIEVYNRVFNFKFCIEKYTKIKKQSQDGFFLHNKQTFLDRQLIKEVVTHSDGSIYSEDNYKYGKLHGKCTVYDLTNKTVADETIYENGKIISSTKKHKNKDSCCIMSKYILADSTNNKNSCCTIF